MPYYIITNIYDSHVACLYRGNLYFVPKNDIFGLKTYKSPRLYVNAQRAKYAMLKGNLIGYDQLEHGNLKIKEIILDF